MNGFIKYNKGHCSLKSHSNNSKSVCECLIDISGAYCISNVLIVLRSNFVNHSVPKVLIMVARILEQSTS